MSVKAASPRHKPALWPLELRDDLQIILWCDPADGDWRIVIALFETGREGPEFCFIADRPIDPRVNWDHFGDLVRLGFKIAQKRFDEQSGGAK